MQYLVALILTVSCLGCDLGPPTCDDWSPSNCEDNLADYYEDPGPDWCGPDEIHQPNSNLCWRVCPADMYWDGDECQWNDLYYGPLYGSLDLVLEDCQKINPAYRLPTLVEIGNVLDCDISTLDWRVSNSCPAYLFTMAQSLFYLENQSSVDIWVGDFELCGQDTQSMSYSCAWLVRMYGNVTNDSTFDFLYATFEPGSAGARALCVREE